MDKPIYNLKIWSKYGTRGKSDDPQSLTFILWASGMFVCANVSCRWNISPESKYWPTEGTRGKVRRSLKSSHYIFWSNMKVWTKLPWKAIQTASRGLWVRSSNVKDVHSCTSRRIPSWVHTSPASATHTVQSSSCLQVHFYTCNIIFILYSLFYTYIQNIAVMLFCVCYS